MVRTSYDDRRALGVSDVDRQSTIDERLVHRRPATVVGSARHAGRRVVSRHPAVFMPIARKRHPQSALAPDTQIVIDGFTRSAGTFALIGFQVAQNAHVRAAHHLHSAAHIMAAARAERPVLVPIRPPRDTVLSAVIREPGVGIGQWLRTYCDFYRHLCSLGEDVVIATFEGVTTDLGTETRRVNERFGTSFVEFRHTPEQLETVFLLIEERARRPAWAHLLGEFLAGRISLDEYTTMTSIPRRAAPQHAVPEERVQRPSSARAGMKAQLLAAYGSPRLNRLRRRAEALYADARDAATSGPQPGGADARSDGQWQAALPVSLNANDPSTRNSQS
jgi:hypothetical protein